METNHPPLAAGGFLIACKPNTAVILKEIEDGKTPLNLAMDSRIQGRFRFMLIPSGLSQLLLWFPKQQLVCIHPDRQPRFGGKTP